jgi:hypothetical protein
MGDLCVICYVCKANIMFKNHYIKSNYRDVMKNEVDTYGQPVFVPDYCATGLAAKKCELTPNDHSMYIRFL